MHDILKSGQRARFGDHMPPAVFPSVFGLFGLGLAWRRAVPVFDAPAAVSQLILGAVTMLFVFTFLAYALKVARRPGVVPEDLRVLPGRAGLASMVLSLYLLAATLVPLMPGLATWILFGGYACHAVLVVLMIRMLLGGPPEQRQVTPVYHLHFVGFIVSPLAAVPLGYVALSEVIFIVTLALAFLIWGVSLLQLLKRDPPPPLRPLLAIHLSPAAVLGIVALLLGHVWAAQALALLSGLILAALLLRARYIVAAGFSPLWGAFTFPFAAFVSLMLLLADAGMGDHYRVIGGVSLVAATLMIPPIAVKVMQAWAKGGLAAKTNAARV